MEDLDISGFNSEGNFGIVNACIHELTIQILQFKDVDTKNVLTLNLKYNHNSGGLLILRTHSSIDCVSLKQALTSHKHTYIYFFFGAAA